MALVPFQLSAEPPRVKSAVPAPDLDALFHRTDGWIGADGAYSVVVSPDRTLWLFSDTWIGKVQNGRRVDATIINNTIGVQPGSSRPVKYSLGRSLEGQPAALVVPADGRGWFWLQAGVADRDRLWMFLNQVEKTSDNGVFGFRSVGLWLGAVANADESPESWRVKQTRMPNTHFAEDRTLCWGAAVLRVGEDLYVYGTDERRGKGLLDRQMVIARVPAALIGDFAAWRYFHAGEWNDDFSGPSRLAGGLATEFSVTRWRNQYLAVYTELGLSPRIMARLAPDPWGPWSAPAILYECPEMGRDRNLFSYAAKAHPALSSGNELVLSYVVNSLDFAQVARDATLYWPRFLRVTLSPSE